MLKENVHEVFIQLPGGSISCINIRGILSSTHIETIKPSTIAKTIPTLTEKDNVGIDARIMNLQRLKSLPVIDQIKNQEIIGLFRQRIIQYIYDTFSSKRNNIQEMITVSYIMTSDLITIDATDTFDTAKGIIKEESTDHLPVVENQHDGKNEIRG